MEKLDTSKWTAVAHKTQRGGPYTFHRNDNGFIFPVSHRGPDAMFNRDWEGGDVNACVTRMIDSYGEDNLVIRQFDNMFEMFEWLSCPDPLWTRAKNDDERVLNLNRDHLDLEFKDRPFMDIEYYHFNGLALKLIREAKKVIFVEGEYSKLIKPDRVYTNVIELTRDDLHRSYVDIVFPAIDIIMFRNMDLDKYSKADKVIFTDVDGQQKVLKDKYSNS